MTPDDNFLAIPEDEYDNDPPPSYDNIGPGPISFRENNKDIGRRLLSIDFTHIYAQYSEYISFTTTNSSGNDPRVYLTNTKWR
ncbi:hypothetical protein Sste5346_001332 [Sporothrix stenoceras]|uniref:Uncharacterized protein n=1 Tax=Sporothrix stenoceras TaxID=5173 RepID=A0ABR3ZQA2_9PEZI